jgi:hypothetical protein
MVKPSLQEKRKIFLCDPILRKQLLYEIPIQQIRSHNKHKINYKLEEILDHKSKAGSPINHLR